MASTATILAMAKLSVEMASTWPMAFLISIGMIGFAVVAAGKNRRKRVSRLQGLPAALGSSPSEPSSTSSWSPGINHEVFLSFRGTDIRTTFANLLHERLKNAEIEVFKDDHNLRPGDEIDQGLKDAIKRSRISIAIFSKDYASSKSCLMELVQMWECRKSTKQIIIPIFYDVTPDDVKNQAGDFATSFKKHETEGNVQKDTIETWKEVLRKVGELVGLERWKINSGNVNELLERVVTRVCQELKKDDQAVDDKLVGIDPHVQEVMKKLGVVYSHGEATKVCGEDVRVIGICGIRGVGKTTLAKLVYNKMHKLFDGRCSFVNVENLRGVSDREEILKRVIPSQERLIADIQKKKTEPPRSYDKGKLKIGCLFRDMKVLIVLDDVNKVKQIEGLVGDLNWFGPGSRIIVTTDHTDVFNGFILKFHRAVLKHDVQPLSYPHALELFRKHAFQGKAPQYVSDHESLSREIVEAIGGLPLAITVTGRYLCFNSTVERIWESTRTFLRESHEEPVKAALENCYKFLDDGAKEIFLDIACFFNGKDKRIPSYMWESCGFFPPRGITLLRDRCLLEIGENNELKMHALLRDFGRKMVKRKGIPQRCRFWDPHDAGSIPQDGQGTGSVVGIGLTVRDGHTDPFRCEQYRQMSSLRYLGLDRANIQGNTQNLPKNLRWLEWRECRSIPELQNLHLKELVILDLYRSRVTKDSEFWTQIRKKVKNLKVLNLHGCEKLHVSFDFPAPINLEILILEDCKQLFNIDPFIRKLECLKSLNLRNCKGVKKLPGEPHLMGSLTELLIDGTGVKSIDLKKGSLQNLKKLSACDCIGLKCISTIGHLAELTSLDLDGASIEWDPETFEFPQKLQRLSLRNCGNLDELPPSIGKLGSLEVMDLSGTKFTKLPESVKYLSNLKTLKMASTHLQKFPEDIVNLGKLEEIDFSGCRSLKEQVCCDISELNSLRILRLSSSKLAGLPESICHLPHLQTLDILKCNQLQALPELPSSLLSLHWGSKNMTVPDLSYLTNLKNLCLKEIQQPKEGLLDQNTPVWWIASLTSLETLELSLSNVTNLPGNFSALTQLRELTLSSVKELDLAQLSSSSSLWTLHLDNCRIQEPTFSSLKYLSELELKNCDLAEIDGLEDLKLLEVLKISHCRNLTNLNGLQRIGRLRKVEVNSSPKVALPDLSECVNVARYD